MALALTRLLPPGPWYAPLASSTWAVPPALLALAVAPAPWAPRAWRLHGSGWSRHLDLAGRWSRPAPALRWRLTEGQARRLLGTDLEALAAVLGSVGAEPHCRLLADWHGRAARRRLAWTSRLAAGLVLAAGGGLVLGAARLWTANPG